MNMAGAPKISVCMIAYNHEKYIQEAVASVLMQKVDCSYELIIGEDFSTDNTRGILVGLQKKHPERIRLLLSVTNLGPHENFRRTIACCRGEYLAYLDGDDYWTSPDKLQRQVEYLIAHPECSMVFSSISVIRGSEQNLWRPTNPQSVYKLVDLFVDNFIPICSALYRNIYGGVLPNWIDKAPFGDWPFHVLHALRGDIGYFDEPMAAYRVHSGGAWTSKPGLAKHQETLAMAKLFSLNLPATISREPLKRLELKCSKEIVYRCLVWGTEPRHGRREALLLFCGGHWPFDTVGDFLRFLVWFFCPFLGIFFRRISLMLKH
jgi:glycosyltransferase involved in cell wall biosynthesis